MPFEFKRLEINDIILIKPIIINDNRGYFLETYKTSEFNNNGINVFFTQENYSYSKKNVLRGLHYQTGDFAQDKLITVINGEILDVVVDLRKFSLTYKKNISIVLNNENNNLLFVPAGFAHGFLALTDNTIVLYKCSKEYSPSNEAGIIWNDSELNINWPTVNPIVSDKDLKLPELKDAKTFS
jgi:dTDP-4-dehydrorhamnose 3,5-epimerase